MTLKHYLFRFLAFPIRSPILRIINLSLFAHGGLVDKDGGGDNAGGEDLFRNVISAGFGVVLRLWIKLLLPI
jgi:hypothetical protein